MRRQWIAVALALMTAVALDAQTPKPTFEVASVKKTEPTGPVSFKEVLANRIVKENGRYFVKTATVIYLIQDGYDVQDYQIVDGPDWIRKDLFEVNAKAAEGASREQMRPMVQSLLAERFGLVVRRERRVMPYLALVAAREDGRLGPSIRKVDDCASPSGRPQRPTVIPPGAIQTSGCGTFPVLVNSFTRVVGKPVLDRTGITGSHSYFMLVSSDEWEAFRMPPTSRPPAPADPSLPSFVGALRDQLGLKLQPATGPMDVLVIDSVQQPTEN